MAARKFFGGFGMSRVGRDRREAYELWVSDPMSVEILVERVSEGETLKELCESRGLPYGRVARWISETEGVRERYELALRLWADGLATETIAISDGMGGDEDWKEVGRDKLRIETRLKLASRLDRERYGERVRHDVGGGVVVVDAGLVGMAGALLDRVVGGRVERVVGELPGRVENGDENGQG